MNVCQGLQLGEFDLRQPLRIADQQHHLGLPVLKQPFPVFVVIESPLFELLRSPSDLSRISYGITANIDTAVDDPVINAEGGR